MSQDTRELITEALERLTEQRRKLQEAEQVLRETHSYKVATDVSVCIGIIQNIETELGDLLSDLKKEG